MGLYASKLPSEEPTLRQLAVRAVQADEAFARYCSATVAVPDSAEDDEEFGRLEAAQFETREALYAALAKQGIDRDLAGRIGQVLL